MYNKLTFRLSGKQLFWSKYIFLIKQIFFLNYYTVPGTSTEKFGIFLLQDLMRMKHFEICTLKLI